ncbi:hypothetical protein EBU02_11295, partial [bacterium]|nr:hypothetical protein [bacterium]
MKIKILIVATALGLTCLPLQALTTGAAAATSKQWKSWATVAQYKKETGKTISRYVDPPVLASKVKSGALPAAVSRIPKDAQVVAGPNGVGQSGGTLQVRSLGGSDLLFEYPFS